MNRLAATVGLLCIMALLCPSIRAQERREVSQGSAQDARREAIRSYMTNMLKEKRHEGVVGREEQTRVYKSLHATYEGIVSDVAASESELHAAVNPLDSNNMVIASIKMVGQGFVLPVYYSRDFGATWTQSAFSISGNSGGDPILAYDNDGRLYFTWIEMSQTSSLESSESILYSVSSDGGETWGTADTVYTSSFSFDLATGDVVGGFGDKEWLAVDRSNSSYRNSIYAAFVETYLSVDSNFFGIVVRRKSADSATFDRTSIRVSGDDFVDIQFPSVGVDADGKVHLFFWGAKDSVRHFLWHSVSLDGGEHFSEPTQIAPTRMAGNTRSPGAVPTYLPQRIASFPQFAVDDYPESQYSGNLYAVWCSNDLSSDIDGTLSEPLHIYFSFSEDGGSTWSLPVRVNDDDALEYRSDHFHPSIDVSPSGAVVVSWYDGREAEKNAETRYYMAVSRDGGETFTTNIPVSTAGFNVSTLSSGSSGEFGIGDYNKTISTAGYAIPVWSDSRNNDGNLNIYAAFVPLGNIVSGAERTVEAARGIVFRDLSPNPVRDRTQLLLRLPMAMNVRVDLIDISGRSVLDLGEHRCVAGDNTLTVDIGELPSGSYLCRVQAEGTVLTRKVVVQR